jgi:hypothetical protein
MLLLLYTDIGNNNKMKFINKDIFQNLSLREMKPLK